MADNVKSLLDEAEAAVEDIDARYLNASFDEQGDLQEARDEAYSNYYAARTKLMAGAIIVTDADVAEMKDLRERISKAAQTQQIAEAFLKAAQFLAKFV